MPPSEVAALVEPRPHQTHRVTPCCTIHACRCLGWEGLCVEPLQHYHAALRANRSCTLVPECISAELNSTLVMQLERHGEKHGSLAIAASTKNPQQRIRGSVDVHIRCNPLHEMLRRAGRTAVDLWSLDVEGHEPQVLGAVRWAKTPVSVLLAEAGTAKDAVAIKAVLARARAVWPWSTSCTATLSTRTAAEGVVPWVVRCRPQSRLASGCSPTRRRSRIRSRSVSWVGGGGAGFSLCDGLGSSCFRLN